MRLSKKKPLTQRAIKNILAELAKHDVETQKAMLEQSITNCWTGVFPIKQAFRHNFEPPRPQRPEHVEPYHLPYRPEATRQQQTNGPEAIGNIFPRLLSGKLTGTDDKSGAS